MKIALLHYSVPPVVGGVESVLAQQARLMADAGHAVQVIAGRGGQFDPASRSRRCRWPILATPRCWPSNQNWTPVGCRPRLPSWLIPCVPSSRARWRA